MSNFVKSQNKGSPSLNAQEAIRNLLGGNAPNGIQPEECGEWAETVQALYDVHGQSGTDGVRRLAVSIANQNERFMALMNGEELDEAEDAGPSAVSPNMLSRGAWLTDWEEIQDKYPPVEWDVKPYIPRGFFTLAVGESGVGKSIFMLLGVCKSYILGVPWPDGTPFTGRTGKVLWIETESALGLNVSRANDFGLPLDQFISIEMEDDDFISLDQGAHRQAIFEAAMRDDVRLIVIDSLSGSHQRDENSTEMLKITRELASLAEKTGKPVIASHHLNKGMVLPSQGITLRHVRGSTAIVQLARVVWALDMPQPLDKSIKRLSVIKNNIAEFPDPFVFTIEEDGIRPHSLLKAPSRDDKLRALAEFLCDLLSEGEMPSTQVQRAVEEAGLSYTAAKRIKDSIGIEVKKQAGGWYWRLIREE